MVGLLKRRCLAPVLLAKSVCWALRLYGDGWEAAPVGKEKDGVKREITED